MLLKENILGVNAKYPKIGKTFLLLDCSQKPFELIYGKDEDIHINQKLDLSIYEAYSFKVYAYDKAAIGKVLRLSFLREPNKENPCSFYHLPITIMNVGWNYYSGLISDIEIRNTPSWDKIVQFNIHHNDNVCKDNVKLLIDSFVLYENKEACYTGSHMAILENAVAFSINGCRAIYNEKQYAINKQNKSAKVYYNNGKYMLPLNVFAAYNDENAQYDINNKELKMSYNGKTYIFNQYTRDVEIKNDTIFVPHDYAMELFGFEHIYTNKFGTIILSKEKLEYDEEFDLNTLLDISYTTIFERPSANQIIDDIKSKTNTDSIHPRLLLDKNDFQRIKEYKDSDKIYKEYYDEILCLYGKESKEYNSQPIEYTTISTKRYYATNLLTRTATWSLLYKICEDTDYAQRAWQEIYTVCNYPDWIDYHFLTTSEICISASLVYDWLYDYLSDEQRELLEKSIYDKALKPGIDRYENRERIWPDNNWNGICNAGMNIGALAILEKYPNISKKIFGYAIKNIEKSLYTFAPDAAHSESAMYWEYHVKYYHMYLAALEKAAGTNYGLEHSPGFLESAYFAYYVQTESGSWPFHDSLGDIVINNYLYWFSNKLDDPFLANLRHTQIKRAQEVRKNPPVKFKDDTGLAVSYFDLMWYKPFAQCVKHKDLPLDKYFRIIGIYTARSGWSKGSVLVGLHGGDNSSSHGDLDTGNFILYAKGYKFFDDFGRENYSVPGYFDYPPNKRWQYYRKRAEGHNTIVIGKHDLHEPDQAPVSYSKLIKMKSTLTSSMAVIDTTSAYINMQADKVLRGILFKNNRSVIVLQDEIRLQNKDFITWSAHTKKSFVTKITNSGRRALIEAEDCILHCQIICDNKDLVFELLPAISFDESYINDPVEYGTDEYQKLVIQSKEPLKKLDMAVVFTLFTDKKDILENQNLYEFIPMENWEI